jgi:hypothetical protein
MEFTFSIYPSLALEGVKAINAVTACYQVILLISFGRGNWRVWQEIEHIRHCAEAVDSFQVRFVEPFHLNSEVSHLTGKHGI